MTEAATERRMSLTEFLNWNDGTDLSHELVDGIVRAMAPPSLDHGVITTNIARSTDSRLPAACYVVSRAAVAVPDRAETCYEADLAISCTAREGGARLVPDPMVIFEVLSPSTADRDRGTKTHDYRQIESLSAIVLVSSEKRHVEVWRRRGAKWEIEDLIGEAELALDVLQSPIPLTELYAKVDL